LRASFKINDGTGKEKEEKNEEETERETFSPKVNESAIFQSGFVCHVLFGFGFGFGFVCVLISPPFFLFSK